MEKVTNSGAYVSMKRGEWWKVPSGRNNLNMSFSMDTEGRKTAGLKNMRECVCFWNLFGLQAKWRETTTKLHSEDLEKQWVESKWRAEGMEINAEQKRKHNRDPWWKQRKPPVHKRPWLPLLWISILFRNNLSLICLRVNCTETFVSWWQ